MRFTASVMIPVKVYQAVRDVDFSDNRYMATVAIAESATEATTSLSLKCGRQYDYGRQ